MVLTGGKCDHDNAGGISWGDTADVLEEPAQAEDSMLSVSDQRECHSDDLQDLLKHVDQGRRFPTFHQAGWASVAYLDMRAGVILHTLTDRNGGGHQT